MDLIILGKGGTYGAGLDWYAKHRCELWTLNDAYRLAGVSCCMSAVFDLHKPYLGFDGLKAVEVPVWMQEAHPDIPFSMAFPLDDVIKTLKKDYFTNTIAYMLAFAIYKGRFKRIFLAGVDYHPLNREEAIYERPCTEYWLGRAEALGIEVIHPSASSLFTFCEGVRTQYGYKADLKLMVDASRDKKGITDVII